MLDRIDDHATGRGAAIVVILFDGSHINRLGSGSRQGEGGLAVGVIAIFGGRYGHLLIFAPVGGIENVGEA